jgi:AcrR family transcriptional regulator
MASKQPKSREESKKETREALVRAGIVVFGSGGLDASLDAICDEAGYTRGAFYVHFADRDAFLIAVMEKVGEEFLDAVLGEREKDGDLLATVRRFITAVAKGDYPLMRDGGVRWHQLLDACTRSPAVRERYVALANDSVERMAKLVRAGQRDGLLREDVDARTVATIFLAAIIGAQTMTELEMPIELGKTAGVVLRMLGVAT